MSHLTLEAMARLIDEEPVAAESAHLAQCAACRAELDALRDDVHALSLLPDIAPPADAWNALERRLAGEGLIRPRRFGAFAVPGMRQLSWAAAAAVVFMAGTMAGRLTSPEPLPGGATGPVAQGPQTQTDGQPSSSTVDRTVAGSADPGSAVVAPSAAAPGPRLAADEEAARYAPSPVRSGPVTLASNGVRPGMPRNIDEAATLLRQTEELYLAALTRYAELATQVDAGDPIARLAALQSIVMTTQAALSQAPADPVINGYHLTALAQRDATMRQVAASTNDRLY